jgi:hypothetical protein
MNDTPNNAILIQHVSQNWEGANLYKVTTNRNIEYCLRHKFDYELMISGLAVARMGDWQKVSIIRTAMMLEQYKYIVWLDADTLIVDMAADLRDGCPPDKIGACRHILTSPPYNVNLDHLNVGCLYMQNTEANRQRMDDWLAGYPGPIGPPWREQGVFNNLGLGVAIDDKWNATGQVNPSPAPVVLGFHGQGANVLERFNMMCRALERSKHG